jgi:hypothetical protein
MLQTAKSSREEQMENHKVHTHTHTYTHTYTHTLTHTLTHLHTLTYTHTNTHTNTHTHTHTHRNLPSSGPKRRKMTPTNSCQHWRHSNRRRRRANKHSPRSDEERNWRKQLLTIMTRTQVSHTRCLSSLSHIMYHRGTPYLFCMSRFLYNLFC